MSLDWFGIFKKRNDQIPHTPLALHRSIVDGILHVDPTIVPSNAIVWNGVAWRPNGTALYIERI